MKKKDEVFLKFLEFKVLVENQTGKKIKELMFDNGGDYNSNAFRRELTTPYNPQPNRVVLIFPWHLRIGFESKITITNTLKCHTTTTLHNGK